MKYSNYAWMDFSLGNELDVAGALIYLGLESIDTMKNLSYPDEVFAVLFTLSQGFEKLVKVAALVSTDVPRTEIVVLKGNSQQIKGHETKKLFEKYLGDDIQISRAQMNLLEILSEFFYQRYNHIDVGNPTENEFPKDYEQDFSIYPNMLRKYVQKHCPQHIEYKSDGMKEHMRCN